MSGSVINPSHTVPIQAAVQPREGPRAMSVILPFGQSGAQSSYQFNFLQQLQGNQFTNLQTLFIDNSLNGNALQMTVSNIQQNLLVPPYSQGTFPIFWPMDATITFQGANGAVLTQNIPMQLLNVPLPLMVWPVQGWAPASSAGQALSYVTGNNGLTYPKFAGTNSYQVYLSTATPQNTPVTIIAGSPNWYLTDLEIAVSGDLVSGGAEVSFTISDSATGGAGTLFQYLVHTPSSAPSPVPPATLIASMHGLNLLSKSNTNGVLSITPLNNISGGVIAINACGGNTSLKAT